MLNIGSRVAAWVPGMLGKLWVAFIVRRMGGMGMGGSLFSSVGGGQPPVSPMLGQSWGFGQYVFAAIGLHVGAKIFGRFVNASEFVKGGWDLILTKALWTEGFARSPWMQATFGQGEGEVRYDEGSGQMFIYQGGRWQAMQGFDGLVQASPMDGIVAASPLDGSPGYQYGHLLPANVDDATRRSGMHSGSGYVSNYHAAYAAR